MKSLSHTYLSGFKQVLNRLFASDSRDTIATQEWTQSHYGQNDPKVSFLEERIASLEGGIDALAVKSLRSARFKVISNLLDEGDNVVTLNSWSLFQDKSVFNRLGIEIQLADNGHISSFRSLINERTKLIYLETISNRFLNVPDFIKIISQAQLLKIPVVVDNTASVGGYLFAPIKSRANLVIESLEDYLPPNSPLKAVIVDGGNYKWFGGFFRKLTSPSLAYYNLADGKEVLNQKELEYFRFTDFLRKKTTNRFNGYPIPQDPFSLVKKLEEIPRKIQKRSDNAISLANYLKNHRNVKGVTYTGLPQSIGYNQALAFFANGFGHYLSFSLSVQPDAAAHFFQSLQEHPAFRYRLSYEKGSSKAYFSVPSVDYDELHSQFEEAFVKLRDYVNLQMVFHPVELDYSR